jgi:hypothetical protein
MAAPERRDGPGWAWFDAPDRPAAPGRDICRSFLACFADADGEAALEHLRRVFLDRRLPPSATDAELRHVEGQRSVVAYVLALLEHARDPHEDRF